MERRPESVRDVAQSLAQRAVEGFPQPTLDPFYKVPATAAAAKPGQVLSERDVTGKTIVSATNLAKATQILYRTTSATNEADATVATIFVPKKPASPPRILSVQLFEDSAALDCTNSWALISNSGSNAALLTAPQADVINNGLANGYTVVAPDFEGSKSGFIAGYTEGQAVLDGIRATLSHKASVPDPTGNKIILTGYSGGAHASAWGAQLAGSYAPELNIIGAAYGGTPVDPKGLLLSLNKGLYAGFAGAGLVGLANVYPDFQAYLDQYVFPNGTAAIADLRNGSCIPKELATYAFKDFFTYINRENPLEDPIPKKYTALNKLGYNADGSPNIVNKFPRYIYQAGTDEIIPAAPVTQYVNDQCAGGASIQYVVDAIGEHVTEYFVGSGGNFKWITDRFDGKIQDKYACTNATNIL
ncbi:LIP-domain-containing protein [Violaceomyces palustris]|uniref:LIP-domain-containing protein n=1 Tax=Violaceomyces palustris TaxID=1673888 RepID=A0ACD0NR00_9BASI|nr:LIP-domain-containing protein [Violaceomyces palustris]